MTTEMINHCEYKYEYQRKIKECVLSWHSYFNCNAFVMVHDDFSVVVVVVVVVVVIGEYHLRLGPIKGT